MISGTRLLGAMLSLGATVAGNSAPQHMQRFHAKLGSCSVTALGGPQAGINQSIGHRDTRLIGNSFLVQRGRSSVLVSPISMSATDRASLLPSGAEPEAIVLTSLEASQPEALMDGGHAAYPNSSVFVDRALIDGPRALDEAQMGARAILATYREIGRLHLIDPGTAVAFGIKIGISPRRPQAETRVKINCGPVTLMFLPSREVAFQSNARGADGRDDKLPPSLVAEGYVVALTDGAFPGIGRVYAEHDGYHWGTLAAQGWDGVKRRRGEVFVEIDDGKEPVRAGATAPKP